MDTVAGNALVLGSGYWSHGGKYLGRYLSFKLIGRIYDPDPEYTFEHGVVSGLDLKFTQVSSQKIE